MSPHFPERIAHLFPCCALSRIINHLVGICNRSALRVLKRLLMPTFSIRGDLALSDTKKECYDVADVFKQASGGVLMWALVIRSGQDLTLQANDYCIPNSVYGGSNPPFSRGKLCPVKPCRWSHMGFRPLPSRTPTASACAEGADRQRRKPM